MNWDFSIPMGSTVLLHSHSWYFFGLANDVIFGYVVLLMGQGPRGGLVSLSRTVPGFFQLKCTGAN